MLLALSLLIPATAMAQEWRYRVRPGDNLWDLAHKYVRDDVSWEQLRAHNNVEDPLRLVPGSVLSFPVAWLRRQPAHAVVVAVAGDITASRNGRFDDIFTPVEGQRLGVGTALRTGPDASLTLEFADGSRLQLHGDSELHLDRLTSYGATGMVDTRLRLPRGRATSHVTRSRGPASHYIVETPGMMSSVRGTEFRVGTDGARSRSEVVGGVVQVSGGNRSVLVHKGHGTVLGEDGRPQPPVKLLPAPDLSAWPALVERMPATLSWPAIEGAVAYRLQASVHPDFRTLVLDRVSEGPQAAFDVRSEGDIHVRVRAIDRHGLEGLDAATTVQVAAQPAPPFAISPAMGGSVAGPRPRLRWTESEAPGIRYRVQLDAAGNGFDAPLASTGNLRRTEYRVPSDLPPGEYVWRVGATSDEGKEGPWSDPIPFTLLPPGEGPGVEAAAANGALEVRWRQGDEGQQYRFQLSRKPDFSVVEAEHLLEDNGIVLPGLRGGTWYMRVRAVDSDGYEHPWGQVQMVKLGCVPCRILAGAGGAALLLLAL